MRKPFIITFQTERKLTDLQIRRRGRMFAKSKRYREHLKRLRRTALRRGDQRRLLPLKNGLFKLLYPVDDPESLEYEKVMATFERGIFEAPFEQRALEYEVWERTVER